MIAVLVATVAVFALWIVALRPSSGGTKTNTTQYQSAIAKAKGAVGTSAAASIAHGGTIAHPTAPAASQTAANPAATPAAKAPAASTASKPAGPSLLAAGSKAAKVAQSRIDVVTHALLTKHVVALLFYNPASADDRAVKRELAAVPAHGHKVVKLAVPLTELSRYTVVTNQVPVTESPTLVLIDTQRKADTIVGFADRFEISQRVDDALAVR